MFLHNHYHKVITAAQTLEIELTTLCEQLGITADSFERYFEQEKAYLDGLKTTPPEVTLKIQYICGLNMLNQIQ